MSFRKRTVILALCVALALAFADFFLARDTLFAPAPPSIPSEKRTALLVGRTLISAIIADTPALRDRGLSGRASLRANEGMLFVFDRPDTYTFWMKDMLFPIDIIWADANGRIVDILKEVSPSSYPELLVPSARVQYVVEVPAGFASRQALHVGDIVTIQTQ